MIRNPFPNNVIPRNRIFNADGSYRNPLMNLYSKMVPTPNQNFVESGQQPTGNFYQGGQPDSRRASNMASGSTSTHPRRIASSSARAASPSSST
jgi:hypothetical protein